MTVAELLSRISSRELTEWMLFYELEPWGTHAEDARMARLEALLCNLFRSEKEAARAAADFMPLYPGEQEPPEEPAEPGAALRALAARLQPKEAPRDG